MQPKYEQNKDVRFQFFPAQRRKVILEKMVANEKGNNPNLTFGFRMPITGEPLLGFPEFLHSALQAIDSEGSLVSEAPLGDFELTGMTIEFFRNREDQKRMIGMVNKSLFKFTVQKEKDGDTFITMVRFKIRVEETRARLLFWHDLRQVTMYVDFVPAQDALKEGDDKQMSFEEQEAQNRDAGTKGDDGDDDSGEEPETKPKRTREKVQ